jgi:hypothetical protein
MRNDLSWSRTSIIVDWERGNYDNEARRGESRVSHEQASRIVQYFREKFADDQEARR